MEMGVEWACREGGGMHRGRGSKANVPGPPNWLALDLARAPGYTLGLTLLCPGLRLRSVVLPGVRLRESMPGTGQLRATNKQALNTKC